MKIFITSKIYDTDVKPITDIEKEVQNDLDNYIFRSIPVHIPVAYKA